MNPSSVDEYPTLAASTIPFTSLSSSNKVWKIQGRVIAKTKTHEYENQQGSGKIFGFDIVDASHDEIHIFAFNELALSLYDQIHIGIAYIVSNGIVKSSNHIFNHLKSHNDIFLGSSSTIQPCLNEYPLIPFFALTLKLFRRYKVHLSDPWWTLLALSFQLLQHPQYESEMMLRLLGTLLDSVTC